MREAAARALAERCGAGLAGRALLLGNAPASFYKYKYPRHYQAERGARGAKVFIFKVSRRWSVGCLTLPPPQAYLQHQIRQEPVVELEAPVLDYQWATFAEMQQLLDRNTFRAVEQMLMPEDCH
jgi:hypothetical protein